MEVVQPVVFRRAWGIVIVLAVGVVCYYLPWFTHKTAGFTMNAFDLAEWSSLHPAVRSEAPPLLTSFLLRAPQVALVAALAVASSRLDDVRYRWMVRLMAALLALRLVPPTDFFTGTTADPNYRQMAWMTALGLILAAAVVPLHRIVRRWHDGLLAAVLLGGILAGWWGLSRAYTLLDNFEIDVQTGPGILGLSGVSLAVMTSLLWPALARWRLSQTTRKGG